MDIYRYDESFRGGEGRVLAGIDEAGRGPLAGPVVASAVVLPPGVRIEGLRDSKELSQRRRESIFLEILCSASHIGVGMSDAEVIDRVNVLEATRLAMAAAVGDLSTVPDLLLIDAVKLPSLKIEQSSPVKGDTKSASIAAASVVAKVVRDGLMLHYNGLYPGYGFDRNKGYGTKEHMERVRALGPCPVHRRTFGGVKTPTLPGWAFPGGC